MAKQIWKPGNMLYPLPAVMVSTADKSGKSNIITVAWTGTVCTNPAMLYISVRPERYSYDLLKDSGEFVVNLTTEKLKKATDWCGVRSGRDVQSDKKAADLFWHGGTDRSTVIFSDEDSNEDQYGSYGNDGHYDAILFPCHV